MIRKFRVDGKRFRTASDLELFWILTQPSSPEAILYSRPFGKPVALTLLALRSFGLLKSVKGHYDESIYDKIVIKAKRFADKFSISIVFLDQEFTDLSSRYERVEEFFDRRTTPLVISGKLGPAVFNLQLQPAEPTSDPTLGREEKSGNG